MKHKLIYLSIAFSTALVSCKKDFLDRPSLDQPTLETYYSTPEQVKGATGVLYNYLWFDYQDKAFHSIGDLLGGNLWTGDAQYSPFLNFTQQSTDARLAEAWRSLYKVIGWSNVIIKTFEQKIEQGGDPAILNPGIAEARFLRGAAYFYIGRIWGDAPIVTDPVALAQTGDYKIPRYLQADVLRFAAEDFQFGETNLPETNDKGRVNRYSAKGMLAKLYLYQKDYANAKAKAEEVISSGKFSLFPDYAAMFNTSANNNNVESLFSLQWQTVGDWGVQNVTQAFVAPGNLLTAGDGWSAIIPSLSLLNSYEPGDKRRRGSVMEHGFTNPDWKNKNFPNGYVYDTAAAAPAGHITSTRANIAKFVVGPGSASESVQFMRTSISTPLLRYADVLLIHAEAVLGTNASTSDATALNSFNKVRERAGLDAKTSITMDDILKERRVELAFEGDYWFDVQRQGFEKAKQLIASQERGTLNNNGTVNSMKITLSSPDQLFLPIPQLETVTNPKLLEPAVKYY